MHSLGSHRFLRKVTILSQKNFTYCYRKRIHTVCKTLTKGDNCKTLPINLQLRNGRVCHYFVTKRLSHEIATSDGEPSVDEILKEIDDSERGHVPVMVDEVLERLKPTDGKVMFLHKNNMTDSVNVKKMQQETV